MEANEFVKKYGWEHAKLHIENMEAVQIGNNHQDYIDNMKRLVESWELVGSYGGLDGAKKKLNQLSILRWLTPEIASLKKAIADVESCL